jgi:hypothetical protein
MEEETIGLKLKSSRRRRRTYCPKNKGRKVKTMARYGRHAPGWR